MPLPNLVVIRVGKTAQPVNRERNALSSASSTAPEPVSSAHVIHVLVRARRSVVYRYGACYVLAGRVAPERNSCGARPGHHNGVSGSSSLRTINPPQLDSEVMIGHDAAAVVVGTDPSSCIPSIAWSPEQRPSLRHIRYHTPPLSTFTGSINSISTPYR